jgi:hypothetical protein
MAISILTAATTVAAGSAVASRYKGAKSFQGYGTTSAGAGSATIQVQGSNVETGPWDTIGTLTLTLATTVAAGVSDSFSSLDGYEFYRANVTAISGTGASVNLTV